MHLLLFVLKKNQKLKLSRSPVENLLRFQKNLLFFVVFECKHKKRKQSKKKSYQKREEMKKKEIKKSRKKTQIFDQSQGQFEK